MSTTHQSLAWPSTKSQFPTGSLTTQPDSTQPPSSARDPRRHPARYAQLPGPPEVAIRIFDMRTVYIDWTKIASGVSNESPTCPALSNEDVKDIFITWAEPIAMQRRIRDFDVEYWVGTLCYVKLLPQAVLLRRDRYISYIATLKRGHRLNRSYVADLERLNAIGAAAGLYHQSQHWSLQGAQHLARDYDNVGGLDWTAVVREYRNLTDVDISAYKMQDFFRVVQKAVALERSR